MNTDRWHQIDELFGEALDRPPDQRITFLQRACGEDRDLFDAVRALLVDSEEAGRVIGDSVSEFAADVVDTFRQEQETPTDDALIGRSFGPYRLLDRLGQGGMGAVYLAERADGDFEKRVALKLVKRGMDTDEILRRFQFERRILASLEHPNIARLYDGGATPDGRPYLVMELVDGETITTYSDARRLTVDQRLDLFRSVCLAVQHAHQNLVVHRDIKPSNILIAADGTPKLLDFGVAKLLDDRDADSPRTGTALRILTPDYAAPEQIRGEAITTATDVYALGAVLYELLTGHRPFDTGPTRRAEAFPGSAGEAARPSSVVGQGAGADLRGLPRPVDAVAAARGTSPDRLRRRLAGDLDGIVLKALAPEPAHRYMAAQQLGDDLARHRAGLPVSARRPTAAYRARKFVRRHRTGVAAGGVVMIALLAGVIATGWQAQRAARERDAAQQARELAEQVSGFLVGLFDSADPLGGGSERTDTLRARAMVDRGAARIHDELHGQPRLQAEILAVMGRVYMSLGSYGDAERMLTQAMDIQAAAAEATTHRALPLALLAGAVREQGDFHRADSLFADMLRIYESGGVPPDSLYIASLSERGVVQGFLGAYDEARALHQRALALLERGGSDGGRRYGRVVNNLAMLDYDLGDYAAAEASFRTVYDIERQTLRAGHPALASVLNNLASSIQYQGRYEEAEPLYEKAVALARDALGEHHPAVGTYLQNLATLLDDQARFQEAGPVYDQAVAAYSGALGRTNVHTAMLLRNLAINRHVLGDYAAAAELLTEAIASLTAAVGPDHLYTGLAAAALGRVLTSQGHIAEAAQRFNYAIPILEAQLPAGHRLLAIARRDLGVLLAARGQYDRAEPLLLQGLAVLTSDRGAGDYLTRQARDDVMRLYLDWGQPERAREFELATH
jgi:eukaryotic-like serine/threonine-protein kinase